MKITTIMTLAFVIIVLVPILLFGNYSQSLIDTLVIDNARNTLTGIANVKEERISFEITDKIDEMYLISSRTKLRTTLEQYNLDNNEGYVVTMRGILKDAIESVEKIQDVLIVGLDGKVIVSATGKREGENVSTLNCFKQGIDKENVLMRQYGASYGLCTSGPIFLNGKKIGVLFVEEGPESILEIIKYSIDLGNTGEIQLAKRNADGDFIFIAPLRFDEGAAFNTIIKKDNSVSPMTSAFNGEEKLFENYVDYRGEVVFSVTRYIDNVDWGLVVKMDKKEILAPSENLKQTNAIILIILIVLTAFLGYFFGKKITRPITSLTNKIEEITKGDLDIALNKSKIFEIQSLVDSLNRILASMKIAILRTGLSKSDIGLEEISEQKEVAEKKAKESNRLYKTLFESSKDAIMTIAPPSWRYTSGNKSTIKLFGLNDEKELLSIGPWDVSPEKQPDGVLSSKKALKMINKAMKDGSNSFEWVHKKIRGNDFPSEVLLTKVEMDGGAFLQVTVRDVTAKKEKEEQFKLYVENSPYGVFVANDRGKYVDVNSKAIKMTGYTRKELLNMTIMQITPKEYASAAAKSVGDVMKGKTTSVQLGFKKKNGTIGQWIVKAVKMSNGQILGFTEEVKKDKKSSLKK